MFEWDWLFWLSFFLLREFFPSNRSNNGTIFIKRMFCGEMTPSTPWTPSQHIFSCLKWRCFTEKKTTNNGSHRFSCSKDPHLPNATFLKKWFNRAPSRTPKPCIRLVKMPVQPVNNWITVVRFPRSNISVIGALNYSAPQKERRWSYRFLLPLFYSFVRF